MLRFGRCDRLGMQACAPERSPHDQKIAAESGPEAVRGVFEGGRNEKRLRFGIDLLRNKRDLAGKGFSESLNRESYRLTGAERRILVDGQIGADVRRVCSHES